MGTKITVVNTIAATAGNATKNVSPGIGRRWKVLYGRITLVCDATVANRTIRFHLTDGTNITFKAFQSHTITAGQTGYCDIATGAPGQSTGGQQEDGSITCIPDDTLLDYGMQFRITVNNGAAGDSFSGYLVVEEEVL